MSGFFNPVVQLGTYAFNSFKIIDLNAVSNAIKSLAQTTGTGLIAAHTEITNTFYNTVRVNSQSISNYYNTPKGGSFPAFIDLSAFRLNLDEKNITVLTDLSRVGVQITILKRIEDITHFEIQYKKNDNTLSEVIGQGTFHSDEITFVIHSFPIQFRNNTNSQISEVKVILKTVGSYWYTHKYFKLNFDSNPIDDNNLVILKSITKNYISSHIRFTGIGHFDTNNVPNIIVYK